MVCVRPWRWQSHRFTVQLQSDLLALAALQLRTPRQTRVILEIRKPYEEHSP
ncbi:MAG: hypothetical protein HWQ38_13050 [Nostoc sp. NMS7]|uniref:hypothetical protein n=1 Tax=Nostoc sp. NMS7 TaxID=2815391 RepID=UPI0025E65A0E|nr:hypothetical protein [Nostoc sp. NMS7]MBN3947338.1 hypothetical protein [Nostoc sp. NMS7]